MGGDGFFAAGGAGAAEEEVVGFDAGLEEVELAGVEAGVAGRGCASGWGRGGEQSGAEVVDGLGFVVDLGVGKAAKGGGVDVGLGLEVVVAGEVGVAGEEAGDLECDGFELGAGVVLGLSDAGAVAALDEDGGVAEGDLREEAVVEEDEGGNPIPEAAVDLFAEDGANSERTVELTALAIVHTPAD